MLVRSGMVAKIHPRRIRKVFLTEWREHYGLTQKQLAERLECDVMTVSRWELGKTAMRSDSMAAVAEALGGDLMEPEDLYSHPDRPTPNQLLRGQPPEIIEQALTIIRAIRKG
jgi:transcriptional regulator with XRE-family HTH domain